MSLLMQSMFHRLGGVPSISHQRKAWGKVRMWRLVMLTVFMLSGRIRPKIRWRMVSIVIVRMTMRVIRGSRFAWQSGLPAVRGEMWDGHFMV